jgi:hypothetical protein
MICFVLIGLAIKIDHRHPEVQQDMFAWAVWVLQVRLAL